LGVPRLHVTGAAAQPEEDDAGVAGRCCAGLCLEAEQVGQAKSAEGADLKKTASRVAVTVTRGVAEDAEHGGVPLRWAPGGVGERPPSLPTAPPWRIPAQSGRPRPNRAARPPGPARLTPSHDRARYRAWVLAAWPSITARVRWPWGVSVTTATPG